MKEFEREVNQALWYSIMPKSPSGGGNAFDNEVFAVRPYSWSDEDENDWHFWHKASGFKLAWYKYPLRSPTANMDISHEQFYAILQDCRNSLDAHVKHMITKWWKGVNE